MSRRKYNQGRITDYSGSDMADPKMRRKALEDYICLLYTSDAADE